MSKETQPLPIQKELPKRETDYPRRHPSRFTNEKARMTAKEELDEWLETEKMTRHVKNMKDQNG